MRHKTHTSRRKRRRKRIKKRRTSRKKRRRNALRVGGGAKDQDKPAPFDVGKNVVGIDHVSRVISDVDASVKFYKSLGFTQVARPFDELNKNGAWMGIMIGTPPKQQGPLLHVIKDRIGAVVEGLHYAKGNLGDVQHIALRLGVNQFKSVLDNYKNKIAESKDKILATSKALAVLKEDKFTSNMRSAATRLLIKGKEAELEDLKNNAPNVSIKVIPFTEEQANNLKRVGVDIPKRSDGKHSIIQIWLPDPDRNYVEICDCNAGQIADELAESVGVPLDAIQESKSGDNLISEE